MRLVALLAGVLLLLPSGCRKPAGPPEAHLRVRDHELRAEVVSQRADRQRGLMYRKELGPDRGMLFVYPEEQILSFYMRNTTIPLSIAYLDGQGTIREIRYMRPLDLTSVVSEQKVRYALEVNEGWFEEKKIEPGEQVEMPDWVKEIQGDP